MAIASAQVKGSTLFVYDEKNHTLFTKVMGKSDQLMGYTSGAVTVKMHNTIYTYDEKGHTISTRPA
ncbi:hypothetical protein NHP21005_12520 [Helicobacter sp. NHP21005]|uniref:hypothetical protein n=1 Tax=Helicobacter felistomachi TaxID=3040201 RepID=UPI00257238BF|nr:hypothetical protein [Helicobacter sp. NHP21005]BEG57564.1 hypothetical protein NHP21005_12520 [Helicobacter sp. NHP21005]